MQLYNKLSAEERRQLIREAGKQRLTISFYQYAFIIDPQLFRNYLFVDFNALDVLGRIYVAHEGINAQFSIPADRFKELKKFLDGIDFLENVRLNIAREHDDESFLKLKVKVRHKIVADGLEDDSFDVTNKGVHVDAARFNELIDDPDTVLVDMRNHYESEIGHFQNAWTPDVDTFRESLPIIEEEIKDHKKDKKLVMYCTGGIRCEKASAYYKHRGFEDVYQLEGGIIEYHRQVTEQGLENKFRGKNFVFDARLSEKISDEIISNCHQCGEPCDTHTNCDNEGCHLLFIQCENCRKAFKNTCSTHCLEVIQLSAEEQKQLRAGKPAKNKKFKKGRSSKLEFKKQ
ncbi:oxygen-dependent tRNA uridine(34) hydroxylase TrhO [Nonlabens ponticola]|uniref:tRNA uridine(34) hydroxylase n=1 Tax=Nonlabens ponticola TaxID=2496866 RepID=A0A3S9MVT5_9FLAO|nr:rhodanese-related sulfurtransferase [Nonlabens ponticola]AZQ43223.1 rhodanese-related sulfurtransferase [Nonlabens ponticola]